MRVLEISLVCGLQAQKNSIFAVAISIVSGGCYINTCRRPCFIYGGAKSGAWGFSCSNLVEDYHPQSCPKPQKSKEMCYNRNGDEK